MNNMWVWFAVSAVFIFSKQTFVALFTSFSLCLTTEVKQSIYEFLFIAFAFMQSAPIEFVETNHRLYYTTNFTKAYLPQPPPTSMRTLSICILRWIAVLQTWQNMICQVCLVQPQMKGITIIERSKACQLSQLFDLSEPFKFREW